MSLALSKQSNGTAATPSTARRLMLVLEYDGTAYAGSQRQSSKATVQACVEKALLELTGYQLIVSLAGRTDAGVHARGQVASFLAEDELPLRAYLHGLNHHLPDDIAVQSVREVPSGFDPRRHALQREYEYYILNSETRSSLWHNRAYHLPGKLDVDTMNEAAAMLIGRHDFASFLFGALDNSRSTVRSVTEAEFRRQDSMVIFRIAGNAFLPHQVRSTVGTLISVGQGKIDCSHFKKILNAAQPGLAGPNVPACGLYLNRVIYNFDEDKNENL
jgi:tRNA pseudouridine38-40 synthase